MALGWCGVCDTLRSITPGAQKWGYREREWRPVPHDVYTHDQCGAVVEFPDLILDPVMCRRCGEIQATEVRVGPCNGDKKAIK